MPVIKAVVGSFPFSARPLEEAIREVVDLQLHYEVDLITDGELRSNMIQYFEQIPGLERLGSGLRIVERITPMKQDKIDEFKKIADFKTVKSILHRVEKDSVKIKVGITGPMTLGTICGSADINTTLEHYNLEEEMTLYFDFSRALLPIVQRVLNMGGYVQIDEPLLSTGQVSLDIAKTVLKDFTSHLPLSSIKEEKISCHVCGSIKSVPDLYDVLLDLDIPILSMGFSGDKEKDNFDVISRISLEKHGKKIAAGFISNTTVEDEKIIMERFHRIEENAGRENISYVQPDCGFRLISLNKVKLILERMKTVVDKII
jgi:5-methyltetrahydropteroyltriglutamate--homocysteine methyltransferase